MRLIDADALNDSMYHEAFETDSELQKWDSGCWIRYKMFENHLDNAPTIDAVPVVRGEWVVREYQSSLFGVDRDWACSECEEVIDLGDDELHPLHDAGLNFCPNCGAKMESEGST